MRSVDSLSALPSLDNFDVVVVDLTTLTEQTIQFLRIRRDEVLRFFSSPKRDGLVEMIVVGHDPNVGVLLDVHPKHVEIDGRDFVVSDDLPAAMAKWLKSVKQFSVAFNVSKFEVRSDLKFAGRLLHGRRPLLTGLLVALQYAYSTSSRIYASIWWLPVAGHV